MLDEPRLLVVDDEEAICEGCRRIFARQGFQVEKTSDARQGLALAAETNYAAILLDIKMPDMDGIQFLEALRATKPEVPVILMTGYPSIPNAISAVRLGAAGYVTKPFTPEEISQAVHRFLPPRDAKAADRSTESPPAATAEGLCFWNDSWLQPAGDSTVRAGTMLTRTEQPTVEKVRLPGIGEVVYQGLPLAVVRAAERPDRVIAAPVSGVVVGVNDRLATQPVLLQTDPCGEGGIATISPTRLEEEMENCTRRQVILFNADSAAAEAQRAKLATLGCQVRVVAASGELAATLADRSYQVLVMDASQPDGPALVGQVNDLAPTVKIILAASQGCPLEGAFRARRIFYYAVEAFADNEIADILDAAFRPQTPAAAGPRRTGSSDGISSISITNRGGTKIRMLVAPGLLRRDDGLGAQIRRKLLDRQFPIETTNGEARIDPSSIARTSAGCDRLIVLLAKDMDRIPGTLVRDTKSEFVSVSGEAASNVTTLVIQPGAKGCVEFPPRTATALAEHIVNDMASY